MSMGRSITRILNEATRLQILAMLPLPYEKKPGKTRKEICQLIKLITPEKVSQHLQVLKAQHKARCYQGKWRKTIKGVFPVVRY